MANNVSAADEIITAAIEGFNDTTTSIISSMPSAALSGQKDAMEMALIVVIFLLGFAILMEPVVPSWYVSSCTRDPGAHYVAASPHHVPVAEPNVSSAAGGVEGHDVSSMGGSVGTIAGSMNDPSQCIESTSSTKKFSKAKPQQYDIEFPLRRPPVRKNRNQRRGMGITGEEEVSGRPGPPERERERSSLKPKSGPKSPKSPVASSASTSTASVPTPPTDSTEVTERPRTRQRQVASRFPSRANPPSTSRTPGRDLALTAATQATPISNPSAEAADVSEDSAVKELSQTTSQSNSNMPSTPRNPATLLAPAPAKNQTTRVSTPRARTKGVLEAISGKKRHVFNPISIQRHGRASVIKKRVWFGSVLPQLEQDAETPRASKATSSQYFVPRITGPSKKRVKSASSPTERATGTANKGSVVHCCDPAFKNNREVWMRAPQLTPEGDKVAGVSVFLPATLVRLRLPQAPMQKEPTVFVKPGGLKEALSWMPNKDRTLWEVPKSCIFDKVPAGPGGKCDTCFKTNKQLFVTPDNLGVICDLCADNPRKVACFRAWARSMKPPTFGFNVATGCDCSVI